MKRQLLRAAATVADLWAARWCLLAGHDPRIEAGDREIFLRCWTCWLRSVGWRLPARPAPRMETAAERGRKRLAAEARFPWAAGAVTGWDFGAGGDQSVAEVYQRQGADVVFIGVMDDVMAGLVGELSATGRTDDVDLLLMPTDGRKH